jgi:hypothetical protein
VQDLEINAFGLLLILDDNYNLTTNNFTTETQRAQRGAQRLFSRAICCNLQLVILAGLSAAAPGSPSGDGGAAALVAACYPGGQEAGRA